MIRISNRFFPIQLVHGAVFCAIIMFGQIVQAGMVVMGAQESVTSLGVVTQTSVDFFLDLTEGDNGSSLNVANFSVRVQLTGPNAGTDVSIVGVDDTVSLAHFQDRPLDIKEVATPTEAFGSTFNFGVPFEVADQNGLMRVLLEVQPNVVADYTLQILTGLGNTRILDSNDAPLPFDTVDGSLRVMIPEPTSFLMMVVALGLLNLLPRQIRTNSP